MSEPTGTSTTARASSRSRRRRPRIRLGAVVALLLLAGLIVWLVARGAGTSSSDNTEKTKPVAVSAAGLATLASALRSPIYWAGPKADSTYELTKTAAGRVYVRYLPKGVDVGADDPYLTIGTYPFNGAYNATSNLAKGPNAVRVPVGGGGVAFYSKDMPTSVYVAYPGSDFQIEVYDPSPAAAPPAARIGAAHDGRRELDLGSADRHRGWPEGVREHARPSGVWAGSREGTTLEVSETTKGNAFVRYLPNGVQVGSKAPYLTVGTYVVPKAFETTKKQSSAAGAVKVDVREGDGVAFYQASIPTNIYVAFPGEDLQIEVYDPTPARARELVASGEIKPVG